MTDTLLQTAENLWNKTDFRDVNARESALSAAHTIVARAKDEKRELTKDESEICEGIISAADRASARRRTLASDPASGPKASTAFSRPTSQWVNQTTGAPVHCLSNRTRLTDTMQPVGGVNAGDLSLGRAIVAMVRGTWQHAPAEREFYNALGGGLPGGGASMVPSQLAANVIDLARAKTALVNAGAITVPMDSDHMTMARVVTDPTLENKAENAAFSGSDMQFGALGFTAHTIGNVVTMSRELADDAPNASQAVENALASALAVHLDRLGLVGDGGADGITGLSLYAGVGETGSVGAILWEDLQTAVVGVQSANGAPNAYIASPTIAGDLAALTSGDGTNSAKLWLGPPPNVAPLAQFTTSSCPNSMIVVGDFTQFVFALRSNVELAVSTEAGDAFEKYQVKIRIVWRGDTGLLQPTHFHRLVGITT